MLKTPNHAEKAFRAMKNAVGFGTVKIECQKTDSRA